MKVCIIANGFTGATLPLAQHLFKEGCDVSCFYISTIYGKSIESLDFDAPLRSGDGITRISDDNKLYQYLDKNVDVNIVPVYKRKRRLEKLLIGKIFYILNKKRIREFIRYIISQQFQAVNIIVHTELELEISRKLYEAGINVCITYHEVSNNLIQNRSLKPEVAGSVKIGCPIIVHSQKTFDDLLALSAPDEKLASRVNLIHFGAFESYLSYGAGAELGLGKDYLLYLGHIFPYKGLKYLYAAINGNKALSKVKVVVAGNGADPILADMQRNEQFTVINRFIENDELVGLIRNCKALVCPYIAASQSGLVQTAMVFNKLVIATEVGAFTEIIKDGKNGYLVPPSDATSLADAIRKVYDADRGISTSDIPEKIQWENISKKYIELFSQMQAVN